MNAPPSDSSPIDWWSHGDQGGSATSHDRGARLLANLLQMPIDDFVRDHWLKKELHVKCAASQPLANSHPANMMPLADVRALLKRRRPRPARFLHDVDVTRYVDGVRSALSAGDEAISPSAVWTAYSQRGYSIRIVHPQQWHQASFELCSVLQEFFGDAVGCSAYLTPRASQGFPPHYDDVEVFVLQLEGCKSWRLYERPDASTAPAADATTEFSSEDLGLPTACLTLHPGDVLYLPRGVVHHTQLFLQQRVLVPLLRDALHELELPLAAMIADSFEDRLLEASEALVVEPDGASKAHPAP